MLDKEIQKYVERVKPNKKIERKEGEKFTRPVYKAMMERDKELREERLTQIIEEINKMDIRLPYTLEQKGTYLYGKKNVRTPGIASFTLILKDNREFSITSRTETEPFEFLDGQTVREDAEQIIEALLIIEVFSEEVLGKPFNPVY